MEHGLYLHSLKLCLKAQGLTYGELAKQLKMTESGVKKMLNAKDISLRRVLKICDVVNISLGELFSSAEALAVPTVYLSETQEESLLKDRRLLAVYWLTVIEKRTASEIRNMQGMNDVVLKSCFQKLVSLNLLTYRKGQYRSLYSRKFRWSDDSKLAKVLNKEWSELTLRRALKRGDAVHRLIAIKLSKPSYENLQSKLNDVFNEIIKTSEREELSLNSRDLLDVTALIAAVPKGVFMPE